MSSEEVALVRRLVAPAEVDLAAVMRNDEVAEAVEDQTRELFEPEFECALVGVTEKRLSGFEGLRQIWLDWLEPWTSYRASEERIVDLEDGRVLWLGRDYGGRPDGREVALLSSAIWRVVDGRVAEVVFYGDRDDALAAAGLGDEPVAHRVLADDPRVDEAE